MKKSRVHPTTRYARDVVAGKFTSCKWEKLACQRHLRDLRRSKSDKWFPYTFDESRADRIFKWFAICRHVRGPLAGKPIELAPWQQFVLGCVFGWVHKQHGGRRFKTAYIRVARGNTKSTMMSAIANYGMCSDARYSPADYGDTETYVFERAPEVVCAAVDREQASIVWGDAREMGLASPEIVKRLDIRKTTVKHRTRGGKLVKLSRDTKNKDGGAPCIIIIDEYHAHPTSIVKDTTSSGKGKRAQCLEFIVTTAGEDAENKPCKIEDDIVKKILAGDIENESYFGIIFELDQADDPHDSKVWEKANPLFRSKGEYSRILRETVKEEHDLAFNSGDNSKKRQWLIKRANLWQVDSEDRYMSGHMGKWKSLLAPRREFAKLIKGREAYVGVDLSKSIDLTADAFVFPLDDGRFAVTAHGFMPEETATKHVHTDRVPYPDWASEGWCTLTPGNVTDDRFIKQHIHDMELEHEVSINEFCYDPWGARQFANVMQDDGYTCVEVRQGVITLSEPTKKFRELVLQDRIVHDGSPVLTWCVSNAREVSDNNGNIKLSKKHKDDSQRIDLIAAVIMAFSRAMLAEVSVYEERGMRFL